MLHNLASLAALGALSSNPAYEVTTHQAFTYLAAPRSSELRRFLADSRLKSATYPTQIAALEAQARSVNSDATALGRTALDALSLGAVVEDKFPRFRHHFFDPIHDIGFHGWAKRSDIWGTTDSGNLYRWAAAYDLFELALTSQQPHVRQAAQVALFRSLGQVVHLVQDACQPSHARDDSHSHHWAFDDGYSVVELWGNVHVNLSRIDSQVLGRIASGGVTQYRARVADYFRDAAEFSNNFFFSDDTIFHNFESEPAPFALPSDLTTELVDELDPLTLADVRYVRSLSIPSATQPALGVRLARRKASLLDELDPGDVPDTAVDYTLYDSEFHIARENIAVLGAQAVDLTARVLDHFFRGGLTLRVVQSGADQSVHIENCSSAPGASSADLRFAGGAVRILYQSAEGELWRPLPGYASVPVSSLAVGEHLDLGSGPLTALAQLQNSTAYPNPQLRASSEGVVILVYAGGEIGAERGAAAKVTELRTFRIAQFDAPDLLFEWNIAPGQIDNLQFAWEGAPTFPVTMRMEKLTCNSSFWGDCDDDEAFVWNDSSNPLITSFGVFGCATTNEYVYSEVWLEDATGLRTQRVPWGWTGVFTGSYCLPGPSESTEAPSIGRPGGDGRQR